MFVSRTAEVGVVSQETRLDFSQRGSRVWARYSGGKVRRGWLVGRWVAEALHFRYAQCEDSHEIHAGHSVCNLERLPDGRLRLFEHFDWKTRASSGLNIFDEMAKAN